MRSASQHPELPRPLVRREAPVSARSRRRPPSRSPRYSSRFRPPTSTSMASRPPTYPTIPHIGPESTGAERGPTVRQVASGTVSDKSAAGPAHGLSPYIEIDRDDWAALAPGTPQPLTDVELTRLRGLGEPLDSREVSEVYLPLSRLLNLYATGARQLHERTRGFLHSRTDSTPFVIGVAGSVAVGKSTVARLLRELLARWDDTPKVELVPTDGFLLPNAELERRGLLDQEGLPRVVRPAGAAALRDRGEERSRRGAGALLLARGVRHRPGRRGGGAPSRRPHRRGPERAPARRCATGSR